MQLSIQPSLFRIANCLMVSCLCFCDTRKFLLIPADICLYGRITTKGKVCIKTEAIIITVVEEAVKVKIVKHIAAVKPGEIHARELVATEVTKRSAHAHIRRWGLHLIAVVILLATRSGLTVLHLQILALVEGGGIVRSDWGRWSRGWGSICVLICGARSTLLVAGLKRD